MEILEDNQEDIKIKEPCFKPFHKTYPRITLALTLGFLFPDPATERLRIIYIVSLLAFCMPLYVFVILDMSRSWAEGDIFNVIRHSTVVGPTLGAYLKMLLMYRKRKEAKEIMDEMNRDYHIYNSLPSLHQELVHETIRNCNFYVETVWLLAICTILVSFPGAACFRTIISYLFDDEPKRYMVHDFNIMFFDNAKSFQTPYYECLNLYTTITVFVCVFNYVSYDGYFALAINHACLKMNIFCQRLEDVFHEKQGKGVIVGVKNFIEEQKRLFRFVALIQDTFDIWLGAIFGCTMIEIGSLLFHISAGYGFDFKYSLFCLTAVLHIFLPCKYAANLKYMSHETSTLVYCSGWERCARRRVLRDVQFMIARAQIPLRITVLQILDFDMELFMFLMRTSYSMFTLLRS